MNISVLSHLTEQAEKARNNAAIALSEDRNNVTKIMQHLTTLQSYRRDYAEQLQQQMKNGIQTAILKTYQQFLASLDDAIGRAQQALLQQEQQTNVSQEQWLKKQQKLRSYETLHTRIQTNASRDAQKREQKIADELSTAAFLRHQHGVK